MTGKKRSGTEVETRPSRTAADYTPDEQKHLRTKFVTGVDIGATTSRLASMNLLLHGLGSITGDSLIDNKDALVADPGERWSVVLANPPFGRSSSSDIGGGDDDGAEILRQDFVVTTSNKQLNFLQHIMTILDINGRAAVVLPDNVLFEGGAGETLRRKLLLAFDFHTLIRLPTGIFYKPGVKANVLFFDKKPAAEQPWTQKLWVYDLRTNKHFTLKKSPLRRADLDDFVESYLPGKSRDERIASERWKSFEYDELVARNMVNLDITWLRDESLENADNLPAPMSSLARSSRTSQPRLPSSRPSLLRWRPGPAAISESDLHAVRAGDDHQQPSLPSEPDGLDVAG